MATLPIPTRLVCSVCGRTVTMLRLTPQAKTQALPCGHTAEYLSVPDYESTPGSAA